MTDEQYDYQPGRHDPGRTMTERIRAWLASPPMLSLVTCARCTTAQVLSRTAGREVGTILRCRDCGAHIATVTNRVRASWIDLADASSAAFPSSPLRATTA